MPSRTVERKHRARFEPRHRRPKLDLIEQEVGKRRKDIAALFRRAAQRWRNMGNELNEGKETEDLRAYLEQHSVPVDDRPIPPYVRDLLNAQKKAAVGRAVDRKRWRGNQPD